MNNDFFSAYVVPVSLLLPVVIVSAAIGFFGLRRRAVPPFARSRITLLCLALGIAICSTGPFVQSLLQTTIDWSSPMPLLHYLSALRGGRRDEMLWELFCWGVFPGAIAAAASLWPDRWRIKVLSSAAAAAIAFIVSDLLSAYKLSWEPLQLGYIVNVNALGGIFVGTVLGSAAHLLERGLKSRTAVSRKVVTAAALLGAGAYLSWFLFVDREYILVWAKLTDWKTLDFSFPGDAVELPAENMSFLRFTVPWVALDLSPGRTAQVKSWDPKQEIQIATAAKDSYASLNPWWRPDRFAAAFRHGNRPPSWRAEGNFEIEGDGDRLSFVKSPDKSPLTVSLAFAPFDIIRFSRVQYSSEKDGFCEVSAYGQPVNQSVMRLQLYGRFTSYVASGGYNEKTRPFKVSAGTAAFIERDNSDTVQIKTAQNFLDAQVLTSRFQVPDCGPLVAALGSADLLRSSLDGGTLRTGLDSYPISLGDYLFVRDAKLALQAVEGSLVANGYARTVMLNNVQISKSRWAKASVELKTTLIAWLLGIFATSAGWYWHKRTGRLAADKE